MKNSFEYFKSSIYSIIAISFFVGCNEIQPTAANDTSLLTSQSTLEKQLLDIDSINNKAIFEWEHGNYQKAMSYILLAYDQAKVQKNENKLALVLNTMGLIQWQLNNNEDAMRSYDAAAQIAERYQMHRLLGLTHTNRGLVYKKEGNVDLAFYHNNQAIEIFKEAEHHRDLAIALNNQGQIFKNQGINDSAKKYYLRALNNYKKVDYKDGAAATFYNLSEVLMRQNQEQASIEVAHKSLKLATEIQSKVRMSEAYKRLADTYEHFNKPDSALQYLKRHNTHYNSLLIANQSSSLAKHQAEMGAEVKTLQIQNLQKEKKLASNRLWFIGIGIFIMLLFLAFIIYRKIAKINFKKRSLERELVNSRKILNIKEQELKSYILDLSKKNNLIDKLQKNLKVISNPITDKEVSNLLEQKILTDEDWETFKSKFNSIYPGFFLKMRQYETSLTEAEIRYMVLLRLDLSGKEMAKTLGISPQSVRVCKMRLKKKLQNQNFKTVEDFLNWLLIS